VARAEPIVVAPAIPFGMSEHHVSLGGTITLDFATMQALLNAVCESAIRQGFRRICILNGHGGNIAAVETIATELTIRHRLPIAAATYWQLAPQEIASLLERQGAVLHACEAETSMILALERAEVDEDVLKQEDKEVEEDKKEEEIEEELDEKLDRPDNVSEAAFKEARGVGVALVLGTYGGVGEGTVLDMIQSRENNLGDLFAQGMSTTEEYRGGEIGDFVAGGGGINSTGTMAKNEGLQTGEGPAEVGATDKKERKVKASSSTDDVIGDVDKQAVSATIRRRMPGLEACYEKALRSNPNLKGKMSYTITINPSGRVTDVKIEEDTVGDASVRSCTEAKIKGWRFVSEGAEESSEVTFSVAFTG
jgi:hypothetical protein